MDIELFENIAKYVIKLYVYVYTDTHTKIKISKIFFLKKDRFDQHVIKFKFM